jgi:Zn-dependent oligopeptidase
VTPLLSELSDGIILNDALFQRVKAVYDQRETLGLNDEQMRLLTETFKSFANNGANLPEDKKARLKEINQELGLLSLQFGNNVVAETNAYQLFITDEAELKGLPESAKAAAKEEASAARESRMETAKEDHHSTVVTDVAAKAEASAAAREEASAARESHTAAARAEALAAREGRSVTVKEGLAATEREGPSAMERESHSAAAEVTSAQRRASTKRISTTSAMRMRAASKR